ncbi:hypothetical protein MTX78_14895 [Hymenobacter tibetensis]|uniref:DUF3575 domain-containing protein n=1 Tax=Hymenobacter tibetensis TaxID=497967 RepID=A0ABY4CTG6_9BACT|nr:hypothetical protein [Hymenobacter tibetensis]UOG73411.1 hypothetical protein MTX78_14895 [Hymenobacter tibetensis]
MNAKHYGAALLLLFPFGSRAQSDSIAVSPHRHLLTVHTLHIAAPFIPALGYEARVRPRWGGRVSLGGRSTSYRYNYPYADANGLIVTGTTKYRNTELLADASLNYYLQGRKPELMGWFIGAGIIAAFSRNQFTSDDLTYRSGTHRSLAARPIVRAGRHWALGQRWLLDTNVAVVVWSDPDRMVYLKEFIGIGAGYRF